MNATQKTDNRIKLENAFLWNTSADEVFTTWSDDIGDEDKRVTQYYLTQGHYSLSFDTMASLYTFAAGHKLNLDIPQ